MSRSSKVIQSKFIVNSQFLDAQFLFDFCYFKNTAFIDYRDDTNNFGRFDWQDFVLNCFTNMFVFSRVSAFILLICCNL